MKADFSGKTSDMESLTDEMRDAVLEFGKGLGQAAEKMFESGIDEFHIGYIFGHGPLGIFLYSSLQKYKKRKAQESETTE